MWHRLETLRMYMQHRLKTLRYSSRLTQHWGSEIFTKWWHRSQGLRYLTRKTQILRSEIFSMTNTDPKTWDIQHIWHRSQALRYSTLDTKLKLWDIQYDSHRSQDLRYSTRRRHRRKHYAFLAWQTKGLSYPICETQTWNSEIFCSFDTDHSIEIFIT